MSFSAVNSALSGMAVQASLFDYSAQRISQTSASSKVEESSLGTVQDWGNLLVSKNGFQANQAVLRAADDMLGTLIDTFA